MRRSSSLILLMGFAGASVALVMAPLVATPFGTKVSALESLRHDEGGSATTELVGAGACAFLALCCLIMLVIPRHGQTALDRRRSTALANWHDDPYGRAEKRCWDGTNWTGHIATAGRASEEPEPRFVPSPGQLLEPAIRTISIPFGPPSLPSEGRPMSGQQG